MGIYYQDDVDEWVESHLADDARLLFEEMLPKHTAKLDRLDKRINQVLEEIQQVFPDAQYYTDSGGFNLVLGQTHEGLRDTAQCQRVAWAGTHARIGDGAW